MAKDVKTFDVLLLSYLNLKNKEGTNVDIIVNK